MSNELALIPYSDIEKMAVVLGKNKMFGKTTEELLPLMLVAQAEGKHPAIVAQEYDVIQGEPALKSRAALSRFQASGGRIEWVSRNDQKAEAKFYHPQGGNLYVCWDIDRAKKAGLANKPNWLKYPAQMLSSRVVAEGVRAVFPGCLSGFYTSEEVQDFEPVKSPEPSVGPRNVTPEEVFKSPEALAKPSFEIVEDSPETSEKDPRMAWPIGKVIALFVEFAAPTDTAGQPLKDWYFNEGELETMRAKVKSLKPSVKDVVAYFDEMHKELEARKAARAEVSESQAQEAFDNQQPEVEELF